MKLCMGLAAGRDSQAGRSSSTAFTLSAHVSECIETSCGPSLRESTGGKVARLALIRFYLTQQLEAAIHFMDVRKAI